MISPEFSPKKEKPFRRLMISIDLDNVIFDLRGPSINFINQRFETNYTVEDIVDYYFFEKVLGELGLNEKETESLYSEVYRSVVDQHRVYRDSSVVPRAVEALEELNLNGHQLFVLTSRPPELISIAEEQLKAAGLDWLAGDWRPIKGGRILIRDQHYWEAMNGQEFKLRVIAGSLVKGKYREFSGVDLHLDDMGLLVDHPLAATIRDKIFILKYKFNRHLASSENLIKNWQAFYERVCDLAKKRKF